MQIVLLASESQKNEWLGELALPENCQWIEQASALDTLDQPDAILDLAYDPSHLSKLKKHLPCLIVVNSVIHTTEALHSGFARINGWPGFLSGKSVEATVADESLKEKVNSLLSHFHKSAIWVDDIPGFISPRIVSSIINEAFLALEESVSTEGEIDIAMKTGTNYPYGPFEWAARIGVHEVYALLNQLAQTEKRYQPAPLLKQAEESC